jgi:hypothetical protein
MDKRTSKEDSEMQKITFMLFNLFVLFANLAMAEGTKSVAILETDGGESELSGTELDFITGAIRESANNTLPKVEYSVLTKEKIFSLFPTQEEAIAACNAASCLVDLGREMSVDYIAQGRVGKLEGDLILTIDLFETRGAAQMGVVNLKEPTISYLLETIPDRVPDLFAALLGNELEITSDPLRASVKIDDKWTTLCSTPCLLKDVLPGKHKFTVTHAEFQTHEEVIEILPGKQTLDFELRREHKAPSEPFEFKSWMGALALDVVGAALIGYGVWQNSEGDRLYDSYYQTGQGWYKVESARTTRNITYALGTVLLAGGICVHIFF